MHIILILRYVNIYLHMYIIYMCVSVCVGGCVLFVIKAITVEANRLIDF